MRTKTLLLTAVLGAAGAVSSMAQANVYSLNAVGYVNLTLQPGFNLIANPLNNTTNDLATLIPTPAAGTIVYTYDSVNGYTGIPFSARTGKWTADPVINPGSGVFVFIAGTAPFPLTFIGTVPQGTFAQTIPPGFSIQSAPIPVSASLTAAPFTGITPNTGDIIYQFDNVAGYTGHPFSARTHEWSGSYTPAVGESFFYFNNSNNNLTWNVTFSVNG
jgi:hypothetical protein